MVDSIKSAASNVLETAKTTANDIANRDIGPTIYNRQKKQLTKERIAMKEKFMNAVVYNPPFDVIDSTHELRRKLLDEAIESGHYNSTPESAKHIDQFVKFFDIDMSQFEPEDTKQYKTFNDFFYRHVKKSRRPVSDPNNDNVIVSSADCRLTVFKNIDEARELIIKGTKFNLYNLVGKNNDLEERYKTGACMNSRLVPQDYHRYHSPISGTVTHKTRIGGTSFTTMKEALESKVNILTENQREIVEITNKELNIRMLHIAIGAAEVGKVDTIVNEGDHINKGDEIGYFSYGGSDIFILFDTADVEWDSDIREHSNKSIETLVQCNDKIAKFTKSAQ